MHSPCHHVACQICGVMSDAQKCPVGSAECPSPSSWRPQSWLPRPPRRGVGHERRVWEDVISDRVPFGRLITRGVDGVAGFLGGLRERFAVGREEGKGRNTCRRTSGGSGGVPSECQTGVSPVSPSSHAQSMSQSSPSSHAQSMSPCRVSAPPAPAVPEEETIQYCFLLRYRGSRRSGGSGGAAFSRDSRERCSAGKLRHEQELRERRPEVHQQLAPGPRGRGARARARGNMLSTTTVDAATSSVRLFGLYVICRRGRVVEEDESRGNVLISGAGIGNVGRGRCFV